MAIPIASGTIYAHFPDPTKRSRIISPVALSSIANVCWRVLESYETVQLLDGVASTYRIHRVNQEMGDYLRLS
jgi:hypothetical protein